MNQTLLTMDGKVLLVDGKLISPNVNLQEKTVTPSETAQIIQPDDGYTGLSTVNVAGDENLVPENIAFGKTIFGVEGNSQGLNFAVIGKTTAPSSPVENTIWIETNIEVPEWVIMPDNQIPSDPVEGMIWIVNSDASIGEFDALKGNSLLVYPIVTKQYILEQWVTKPARIYKNGEWINLFPQVATIEVTYTKGFVCTCTDGETTLIAPNTNGYYVFPIPNIGTWTISCPDEKFVESKTVVIDTEEQVESISVLYFPATITVTYPESTLTVTNGVRTFTHGGGGTVTFNVDQAGDWEVSVPNTDEINYLGNTTVTLSTSGQSETVTITKFTATITVTYPESTVTCTNGNISYSHSGGGTKIFTVYKAGSWSVSVPNTNNITYLGSTTVTISNSGESKTVTITKFTATINVTYPKGTCTCTCGSTSYSHSGGGTKAFVVNKAGTWTVKATPTAGPVETKTVSITTNSQSVSVTLDCKIILLGEGINLLGTPAFKFSSGSAGSTNFSKNSDGSFNLSFTTNGAWGVYDVQFPNTISRQERTKIRLVASYSEGGADGCAGIRVQNTNYTTTYAGFNFGNPVTKATNEVAITVDNFRIGAYLNPCLFSGTNITVYELSLI